MKKVNRIDFDLYLESPTIIGGGGKPFGNDDGPIYIPRPDNDGRIYIPGSSIKGQIRRQLEQLLSVGKVKKDIAEEIFGNEMRAGKIRVDDAVAQEDVKISTRNHVSIGPSGVSKGRLYEVDTIPRKTVFSGSLAWEDLTDNEFNIGVRLALLGMKQVGRGTHTGYGNCSISIKGRDTKTELLYELEDAKAGIWLQDIDQKIIDYFSKYPSNLYKIHPREFEKLVAALFQKEGFSVELTPETRDGGYDILAVKHDKLTGKNVYLIECKRYSRENTVGIEVVRSLMGVIQIENATKGIIATTSSFSSIAQKKAKELNTRISLLDYDILKDWLSERSLNPI